MRPLDSEMLTQYQKEGYLLLPPEFLGPEILPEIANAMSSAFSQDSPRRILERDGTTVRSVYGLHQTEPQIAQLARHPKLLGTVQQVLGDEVYVHQSKINQKASFTGDQWEWHQDYIYWWHNDGIQKPDMINVAIFLDEVTEFNGPLTFIPGSHTHGVLSGDYLDGMPQGYEDGPTWVSTLTATEKFKVATATIERLAKDYGLVSPKGPAGSMLIFHPNILHSSALNISPFRRALMMFVFNAASNCPSDVINPRPGFLAEPNRTALQPAYPG